MSDYDVIIIGSGAGGGTLAHRLATTGKKIGRNDACPCGSGAKYKRCCATRDKVANR